MIDIQEKVIGKTNNDNGNTEVISYTLKNENGMEVEFINYGATIKSIKIPTKNGLNDIVLGFDDISGYENDTCYIGSTVGRVANRINKGIFTLNDKEYKLAVNNGVNHLHGGNIGFNKKIWSGSILNNNSIKFKYLSIDGEEGYPGNLDIIITFSLSNENELSITYNATSDEDTVINLTNHSYFNLDGIENSNTITDHILEIDSVKFTESDNNGIPTGNFIDVAGTPLDFTVAKEIGRDIEDSYQQLKDRGGFDHNYILNYDGYTNFVAKASSKKTGIEMSVFTNQRGIQLYSGNYLEGSGKNNTMYSKYSGFCLETQNFPNAINTPEFFSGILKKDEVYTHKTIFKFKF